MRKTFGFIGICAVAGMIAAGAGSGGAPVASASAACPARDLSVSSPYPITGYWLYPSTEPCTTRKRVEAIHKIGGDTLITLGPRMEPRTVDSSGRVRIAGGTGLDPAYADCIEGGRTCYQEAKRAIGSQTIRRVVVYNAAEHFGIHFWRCNPQGLDSRIERNGRLYYRLLLPVGDAAGQCDTAAGRYDLVLVAAGAAAGGDGIANLVKEADSYRMRVYPGLPVAPRDSAEPWNPDLAYLSTATAFTRRIADDYRERHGRFGAFAGVYQPFEIPLRDRRSDDPVLRLYGAQHKVVAGRLSGKRILVSPYWDARRPSAIGHSPDAVIAGFKDVAGTRAGARMIIAPQDGRGVGKVGAFLGNEAGSAVDPRLVPVVGKKTYGEAYHGSTHAYFKAAASASNQVSGVELWMNLESFEPTRLSGECGTDRPARGRTGKRRTDRQLMVAGAYPEKVISYSWDPYLTCTSAAQPSPLSGQLAGEWRRAIVIKAGRSASGGRSGIRLHGYNFTGSTVKVTYFRSDNSTTTKKIPVAGNGSHDPHAGEKDDRLPDRVESLWVPFKPEDLRQKWPWIYLTVINNSGAESSSSFVLSYR